MKRLNILLAAAALSTLSGCGGGQTLEAPARPVRVEAASVEGSSGGLRYSASIQAEEQVPLAFKVGGYVAEIAERPGSDGRSRNLQQGDQVEKGAVLARIREADYAQKRNQARAQVAEAEAGLEKARADHGRAEALFKAESLTRPDYDAARAALKAAEARFDGARAQLEAAEIALKDCALVAPLDAVVIQRAIEVGSLAGPGTLGFVLADLTRVKAVFGAPDDVFGRLRLGLPLAVTSEALTGSPMKGSITALSPSADPQSRVFGVEVTIENPSLKLRAGMIVTVEVPPPPELGAEVRQPSVSLAAVVKSQSPSGRYAVFVLEAGSGKEVARARDVTLGPISGNRVVVTSGLKAGEKVVVTGASLLYDKEVVRTIPESEGE